MFKRFLLLAPALALVFVSGLVTAEVAVRDGDIAISEEELAQIIQRWPANIREAAANDLGARMELINAAMAGRKMAREIDALTPQDNAQYYWDYQDKLLALKRRQRVELFLQDLQYPDMEELAREHYVTEKDKYAKVPEKRLTSHILFKCPPGRCEREPVREKAAKLIEELRNGADFEAMVEEYSEDKGTKAKKGLFDRWMQIGEQGVLPTYSGGAFSIAEIGGYSEPVDSPVGIHIIRLDDIQPVHYKTYEEVREAIIADLQKDYRRLALKDFHAGYLFSDDGYINGDTMDRLLEPYKTAPEKAPEAAEAAEPTAAPAK
ncbi:MAG: peptidylprolyl isomerase [Parahaliea sp.]